MKPLPLTGAAVALLTMTMTAIPAWAACNDTSSVREPDQAVQSESNADVDIGADDAHVRAEEVAVEDLDEHQATEGNEDPAPQGYTTNVPPEKIIDDADVGETTPANTEEKAEDKLAAEVPASVDRETKAMKTSIDETGQLAEKSPEEEQASMAKVEETTETVAELASKTVPGEGGQIEASTGGAEPTENWFGCNPDGEPSEGETCEEADNQPSPDASDDDETRDYATLEEGAKREVDLDAGCDDDAEGAGKVEG